MKVELQSPLKTALLKGCPWMDEGEGSSEGGQDEVNQQLTASTERFPKEENRAASLFT